MNVLDLFSGIGGFSLGLERAGMKTIAFCEVNEFCRKILKKHWPTTPIFKDVKTLFPLKSSAEDSPVKISARWENAPEYPENVLVCGNTYARAFAWYDRSSQCWRTWQSCLGGGFQQFSGTWPRSGMTRNGIAYRLPTLVPGNFGTEFGLWPTPNATAFKGGRSSGRRGVKSPERNNWQDFCSLALGQRYPVPETAEQVMGYPTGYTEIPQSETP